MASPDRTRSTALRVFVVWGLGVFLLVVLSAGFVYRYLAFRWWPELVAKTTPSIEHLLDCFRSTRNNPDAGEFVLDRLQDLFDEGRPVLFSVARRLADRRADPEAIVSYLCVVDLLDLQSDAEHRIAWDMVVPYMTHPDEAVRDEALHCVANLADFVDGSDDDVLVWLRDPRRDHFDSSLLDLSGFYDLYAFVRILRRLVQRKDLLAWQGLIKGLHPDESGYLQAALKSYQSNAALPDSLIDLLEENVRDGHWVGKLLWEAHLSHIDAKRLMQFAHAHPEHRRSVWVALCRHPTVGQLGDLAPYREWWGDWLQDEDPETAAFILMVLGDHPHPSYRSDVESMLSARDPTLRRLAVVAVSIINWEGADVVLLRAVFDPECSGMALRALPAVIGPDTLRHLEAMEGVDRSSEAYRQAREICQDHHDAPETPEPASR